MKLSVVLYLQSYLIMFIALFEFIPLFFAIYYDGSDIRAFIYSIVLTLFVGAILNLLMRKARKAEVKIRESFGIVTFGWLIAALFATLPFLIHSIDVGIINIGAINSHNDNWNVGTIDNFTDAYFEMMSGFTTTGSSILTDIEALPKGLLFWRSLTHWLGGMGIILLAIAILPALGVGGMQLYQAEVPGPTSDKIAPRVSQTAKILWGVYLLLTVLETILLMFGGMDLFDALCHTFGTVATGGFSTKNLSIGHYNSVYIDYVITIFMFLAGASFSLHYRFLKGQRKAHIKDHEFRFYVVIILLATLIIVINTLDSQFDGSINKALRYVLFQVVSVITTTGYGLGIGEGSIYHFAAWSTFCQFLFIMLMFNGGSAGSTGGGIKSIRVYLIMKFTYNEILKFLYPRHIKLVRIGKEVIPDNILLSTLGFIIIHTLVLGSAILIMNLLEDDLIVSFSAVVATLNNIGPGLGSIGPNGNFADISVLGKWVLTFCMLLGRLELYSVIILFAPAIWKKI